MHPSAERYDPAEEQHSMMISYSPTQEQSLECKRFGTFMCPGNASKPYGYCELYESRKCRKRA